MDETRNKTGYESALSAYRTHFTIHCPGCNVKTILTNNKVYGFIEGKITCSKCGYNKQLAENNSYEIAISVVAR